MGFKESKIEGDLNKKRAYQKFNDGKVSAKGCPAKIVKKVENLIVLTNLSK